MITVHLYGLYRLEAGKKEYLFENARDIAELLSLMEKETKLPEKEWRKAFIYVNGTPFDKLGMFKCPLKDGDTVSVLSPASGG